VHAWILGCVAIVACKYNAPGAGPATDGASGDGSASADGPPAGAWLDPWQHRKSIVLHASQIEAPNDGSLDAFPVLISFSDSQVGTAARPDGNDIVFTAADATTLLEREIESYAAGVLVAWVKIPSLPATTDTTIYMYYGNDDPPELTPELVWENFLAVYHLDQDPAPGGPGDIRDATANNHDGTAEASMDANLVTGQIGSAILFDGSNDFIDFPTATDLGNQFTISLWINTPSGTNIRSLLSNSPDGSNTDGFRFFFNSNQSSDRKIHIETGNGGSSLATITGSNSTAPDTWAYVAGIVDRTAGTATIFVDGAVTTGTVRKDFNTSSDYEIGRMESNNPYKGMLDEIEIASTTRPLEWIKTTLANQKTPGDFETLGAEESP